MSTERGSQINKVNNTFTRIMTEINKFENAFKEGGDLEQAILQVQGSTSSLGDIRDALSNVYNALEDGHYDTLGHIQGPVESVRESKRTIKEGVLDGDDDDGFMARSQLYFLARDAITLHGAIDDRDDLESWVQSKIAQASKDIDAVRRYTEYNAVDAENSMPHSHDEEIPMQMEPEMEPEMEESTITEIDHAREYVRVHAPERMLGMHPVAKNAFLADLEKTYPGMRKDLGEGTWAVPETQDDVKVLTDLMQNPIPVGDEGDNAAEVMYSVLGDDELFDEFVEMAATLGPEADARPAIENRLKELGIMESMNFDEKRTDDLQVVAKDLFKNALANAKKKSKTATVKEEKLNEFGMLAPIAANLAVKGAEKLYKKYTDNKSSKGEAPSSPSPAAEPSKQHKQQPKIAQPKVQGLPNVKKAPPVRPDAARSKSTPKKPLAKEHIAPAVATPTAKPAVAKPAAKKAIRKPAGRTAAKPAMAAARKGVTQEGNAPEPRKMQVTTADRDNKTEAWKRFKAGDPAYEYKKLTPKTISGDN